MKLTHRKKGLLIKMQINRTRLLSNTNTVYMWNFYEFRSHKLQIAKVLTTICLEMASKGAKEAM